MKYLLGLMLSVFSLNSFALGSSDKIAPPIRDAKLIFERHATINPNGVDIPVYAEYFMLKPTLIMIGKKQEYAAVVVLRVNDGENYQDQIEKYVLNFGCDSFAGGVQELDTSTGEKIDKEHTWKYVLETTEKQKTYYRHTEYMSVIATEICRAAVPNYDNKRIQYLKDLDKK